MVIYQVELNDEAIKEQIGRKLTYRFGVEISERFSNSEEEIAFAVKELVLSHKDEIVDRVVSSAAKYVRMRTMLKRAHTALKGDEDA